VRPVDRRASDVVTFDRFKSYFGADADAFARYVAEVLPVPVF
jgi:hypothetical protein